jgi:hypothetical protein
LTPYLCPAWFGGFENLGRHLLGRVLLLNPGSTRFPLRTETVSNNMLDLTVEAFPDVLLKLSGSLIGIPSVCAEETKSWFELKNTYAD